MGRGSDRYGGVCAALLGPDLGGCVWGQGAGVHNLREPPLASA